MAIEKTVSELAEILGISRQAMNNRVKTLAPEDTDKNEKGVTVVTRSGLIKLEEIYKKTIFEDEPVSEEVKQRELMEILVDEKNAEILRLYEQLKAKDNQLAKKDEQLRVKDVQIAEKDKQLDQQQQLTAKAMSERETLLLELDEAKEQVQEERPEVLRQLGQAQAAGNRARAGGQGREIIHGTTDDGRVPATPRASENVREAAGQGVGRPWARGVIRR